MVRLRRQPIAHARQAEGARLHSQQRDSPANQALSKPRANMRTNKSFSSDKRARMELFFRLGRAAELFARAGGRRAKSDEFDYPWMDRAPTPVTPICRRQVGSTPIMAKHSTEYASNSGCYAKFQRPSPIGRSSFHAAVTQDRGAHFSCARMRRSMSQHASNKSSLPPGFVGREEAARMLGVAERTFSTQGNEGRIACGRLVRSTRTSGASRWSGVGCVTRS